MADANSLKDQGNKAFAAKDYDRAVDLFTQAIALDPQNHVLFSNRSAARAGKKEWDQALEDAEQCLKLNPSWSKGYARKGAALHGARKYDASIETYEAGLKLEDSPALRKGLKEVQDAKASESGGDELGLNKLFADPNLVGRLALNPKTAKHLADPSFMQKLQMIQANPKLAQSMLGSDPRMIDVLGVLMGIDMQGFAREEGSDDLPTSFAKDPAMQTPQPASRPAASSTPAAKPSASAPPPPPAQDEDVEMTEEDAEDVKAKAEAEAEKNAGAAAYKARDFPTAEAHFKKAWDLWPKDITFLTNLGAVHFEMGDYDTVIATCEKAVDAGRELRADYKLIAKALGRIGSAYAKKNNLPEAIKYYQKSLTEHRTPDVLNKLREAEKAQAEAARRAYIDPAKAAEAREEGNKLFKAGDFASAVKFYSECVKRDPDDPKGWTNRAAAYQKLVALPEALKDANKAIEVDSKYVKAYIRKSHILLGMREYNKALDAIQLAAEHDDEHKSTSEIQQQMIKIQQAMATERASETDEQTLQRAMKDPEVAEIMGDPIMRSILEQAQSDPKSLQDHMKNPSIQKKIMKLVNAGVLRTR